MKHQLKIAEFFKKPAGDVASPPPKTQKTVAIRNTEVIPVSDSGQASDYEKTFFPFFLKPNVQLAPTPFARDEACRATISAVIDDTLAAQASDDSMDVDGEPPVRGVTKEEIIEMLHIPPCKLTGPRSPPFTDQDQRPGTRQDSPVPARSRSPNPRCAHPEHDVGAGQLPDHHRGKAAQISRLLHLPSGTQHANGAPGRG